MSFVEEISEEEYMDKDAHEGFLISDESDRNDPDSDTEAESLLPTPEVEIENDDESITQISKEEEAELFLDGARFMQDINEVIKISPEQKNDEVLRSTESIPKREKAGAEIYQ